MPVLDELRRAAEKRNGETMKHFTPTQETLVETFENHSSELYWLAFLLTGNADRSVLAFDKALEYDEEDNPFFGDFMNAWARKLIVVEALGTIEKELRLSMLRVARLVDDAPGDVKTLRSPEITQEGFEEAVISIDAFPRCAMLLTVFEGMSLEAASVLLNADEALTAAAQRIGLVQLTRNLAGGRDAYPGFGGNPVPVLC
jgi:hypothetical protein